MATIQLQAKTQYQDIINATFLYVDSVTSGLGIKALIYFEGGQHEEQEIISGSKFMQGRNGERIEKVIFINPSTLSADIDYRYSVIFGYDEQRVIGDVNAVTKKYNDSRAGTRFVANSGNIGTATLAAQIMLWNPAASGVDLSVDAVIVGNAAAGVICWYGATSAMFATPNDITAGKIFSHKNAVADISQAELYWQDGGGSPGGNTITYGQTLALTTANGEVPSPGHPAAHKWGPREPIIIEPGRGVWAVPNSFASNSGAIFYFEEIAR